MYSIESGRRTDKSENRTGPREMCLPVAGTNRARRGVMPRPRRVVPGARWFITVRCARAQFRLRPDADRTQIFEFILAKALERTSGLEPHAAVQMLDHPRDQALLSPRYFSNRCC